MVDRRYSDFAWLVGQLASQHPGVIIPPIPEKQAVGRFSAEFVESRRRALEKFLVRVLGHAELGRSHWLVLFLQANEDALNRAKDEAKAAKPKITTASAMAWFDSTVNTLANGKVSPSHGRIFFIGCYGICVFARDIFICVSIFAMILI